MSKSAKPTQHHSSCSCSCSIASLSLSCKTENVLTDICIPGVPICSQLAEFEQHDNLYIQLAVKDRANMELTTGCLFPCTYLEYRLGAKAIKNFNQFGLMIAYGTVETTVLKEFFVYTFFSLVSDFGGSLGLFIGFSFFALWDIMKDCLLFGSHIIK